MENNRAVLICTEYRGVFFGYLKEHDRAASSVKLLAARNCIKWGLSVKGFLGLAADGPDDTCRIGPAADIELFKVTCIVDVSADAVVRWEAAPWKK